MTIRVLCGGTDVSLDSATSEDADDNDAGDAHEHGEETA